MNNSSEGKWEVARLENCDNHDQMIEYVSKCIRSGGNDFYFLSKKDVQGQPDICHMGNGPNSLKHGQEIVSRHNSAQALDSIREMQGRLDKYKAALEVYADEGNWNYQNDNFCPYYECYIKHGPNIAQEALKEENNVKKSQTKSRRPNKKM